MTLARCTRPPDGAAAQSARRYAAALPVLETERLVLRAPTVADFPLWLRISNGPGCAFIGGPIAPDDAWAEFCGSVACWLLHGHGPFVLERRSDRVGLGFVSLGYEWEDEEAELGWSLAEEARGFGYAREAAHAVRDWGFELLPDFVSYIDPANAPSTRLARSLGAVIDREASARLDIDVWRHARADAVGEGESAA